MYYETYGDEKAYPIVLIHPIGGNIKIWEHEISIIQKKSLRIIAYEIRGYYRSNMGECKSFTMEDLANDLERLLRKLGIHKCTLIGHSIGGAIASLYVQKNPQSTDAIIFINASSTRIPDKDLEKHFTTRNVAKERSYHLD
jgi:3-oxoadipate enol-lactonase